MSVEPPPAGEPSIQDSAEPPSKPSNWERWLIWGPARHDPHAEMFFPWWARWLVVLAGGVAGWFWRDLGVGQELGWFLAYSALVAMSLAASFSMAIFIINLVLAVLWIVLPRFWPLRRRQDAPVRWRSTRR